ncbi:MAG: hypothetical protein WCE75_06660 [Terracidiphilus sp.]
MDERAKHAFDFASDLAKQLITLSTSIVTVTLLFGEHFPKSVWAKAAWVAYLVSTICGVWTLMALTGTLGTPGERVDAGAIYRPKVRIAAGIQVIAFGVATILTLVFVLTAF